MTTLAQQARAGASDSSQPGPSFVALLRRLKPPLRDRRFWATQTLVALIALSHDSIEMLGPHLGMEYFLPTSLFFIPVVYSAVYFGVSGSIATAFLCTLVSVPNWVLWHSGSARFGVIAQMAIVDSIAVFVGSRVDQQTKARKGAEQAERRYRGLFETAGEAILVVDKHLKVVEHNVAAISLLGRDDLSGRQIETLFSREAAAELTAAIVGHGDRQGDGVLFERIHDGIWIDPVCTPFAEHEGLTQIVLRNVTEQKRRQAGLETYSAQILKAQEEERKRIAQELHDETVQSLLVLCRMLDSDGRDGSVAYSYAKSIVESVRGFARGLRPPALDDLGLGPALDRLLTDVTSRSGIEGNMLLEGHERRLAPEVELALFRICQEALHNVERHSRATSVTLALEYLPFRTQVSVQDDGHGFQLPQPLEGLANANKLGLLGMQERARTIGGTLAIQSILGSGTRVTAEIPVR